MPAEPNAVRPGEVERKRDERAGSTGQPDADEVREDAAQHPEERRGEAREPEVLAGEAPFERRRVVEERRLDRLYRLAERVQHVLFPGRQPGVVAEIPLA